MFSTCFGGVLRTDVLIKILIPMCFGGVLRTDVLIKILIPMKVRG